MLLPLGLPYKAEAAFGVRVPHSGHHWQERMGFYGMPGGFYASNAVLGVGRCARRAWALL
jgi:hypothetical protein